MTGEKIGNLHAQSIGDPRDVVDRHVALSALDRADVGPVKAAGVGERLLRVTLRLAVLSNHRTEPLPDVPTRYRHDRRHLAAVMTFDLQPMSSTQSLSTFAS